MNLMEILDRLELLLNQATRVPLMGKVMVDPDDVLTLVDELRETIPPEVREAERVTRERERILQEARDEAENTVRDAKAYAEQLTDETAIAQEAQAKADEVIDQAKRVSREIRLGAREYADDLLSRLEENLQKMLEDLKKSREELRR